MTKPRILMVGTYTMPGPSRDAFNVQSMDIASTLRRRQLRDCAERLAAFGATRVALDVDARRERALNREYRAFCAGKAAPPEHEGHQLGFWVARAAGHEQVHAIDHPGREVAADPFAYAYEHGQDAAVQPLLSFYERQTPKLNALLHTGTVLALLRFINDEPRLRRERQTYLGLAEVGVGDDYPGAEWVAAGQERSLHLFANLLRLTETREDRILVICGSGELGPLLALLRESGRYAVERANRHLA